MIGRPFVPFRIFVEGMSDRWGCGLKRHIEYFSQPFFRHPLAALAPGGVRSRSEAPSFEPHVILDRCHSFDSTGNIGCPVDIGLRVDETA